MKKFTAFKLKLELWDSKLEKKSFAPFPQINTYIGENELNVDDYIFEVMKRHVLILRDEIAHYFPDLEEFEKCHMFINNSFILSINDLFSEENLIQEQFIDFIDDGGEEHVFREMCCSDFYIEMAHSHPDVAKMTLKVLMPFATTYEFEVAFCTLLVIRIKSRNRLEATNDMRVALAKTKPNLEELVQAKQMHPSH